MTRTCLSLLFCALFAAASSGQSPYQYRTGRELGIGAAALGLGSFSHYFYQRNTPLNAGQIAALDKSAIPTFDRWATTRHSLPARRWSDALLYASTLLPAVLHLSDKPVRKDFLGIGALYAETAFLNLSLTNFVKNTVRRTRPYAYHPDVPLADKTRVDTQQSFYSGHTSQSAAMCFLAASIYADYHPESPWKPLVWATAATLPAVTGLLRIRGGKHFPTDVIVGYVAGAAIGWGIPRLHRMRRNP
jgi:membrane-associated phospholipid phosphatase